MDDNTEVPLVRGYEKFPRNDGPIKDYDGHARLTGPCGETMEFWLLVRNEEVVRASFVSDGCATSHACGSVAAFLAETETVEVASAMGQRAILGLLGGLPKESEHCALLAANALKAACQNFVDKRDREGTAAR